jgi:hypothetical protein
MKILVVLRTTLYTTSPSKSTLMVAALIHYK